MSNIVTMSDGIQVIVYYFLIPFLIDECVYGQIEFGKIIRIGPTVNGSTGDRHGDPRIISNFSNNFEGLSWENRLEC